MAPYRVFPEGATKSSDFLFYLDGVFQEVTLMDKDANAINSGGGQVALGCWTGGPINFYKGIIDEAAIFPSALTDDDIARAARSGLVNGRWRTSPQAANSPLPGALSRSNSTRPRGFLSERDARPASPLWASPM